MHVAVVGTGLIGGSIGLALHGRTSDRVTGYDRDPAIAERAVARGAVERSAPSAADAVRDADLVVLAVPVTSVGAVAAEIAPALQPHASVTDVGSAKAEVVETATRYLGGMFVGGHPMAGSELRGIEAADGDLFADAAWILTPTDTTSSVAYDSVREMASSLGSRVVALEPRAHDELVALLSHLPQLAASALVEVAAGGSGGDALLTLAGGGFRDVTRIAASDPELWVSILAANRGQVIDALARMEGSLAGLAAMLHEQRWDDLRSFLERSRAERARLFVKPVPTGTPVALSLLVPDRPGVLAEVTTAAGRLGANIEDLRIVHSTEGGRGRLELVIAGEPAAEALADALAELGYHVDRPGINFST